MSSSVDSRIVTMKFENTGFERGVSTTLSTLDKLKNSLNFSGSAKGLDGLQSSASRFNLHGMENATTGVSKKFLAMSTVAITALASITSRAVTAGLHIVKGMTVAPLQAGLKEYETNLNSIQTILANTGLKGKKGLSQVNGALAELNHYSDKTIYSFSEMARNIGTFTAAGVKLKPATAAIKGIANLAAVSGSSADQASTAMYQLSQAMASGTVKLQDWNSVTNAGMGGKVFQNALKETARAQGVNVDAMIKKNGSFRESLKGGWLSTDVLTETLSKFTGDLTSKQLKQMGYTDKQIKGIMAMGKTATEAATKIKTFSQLTNTLQETSGSGWAATWQILIGNFGEAKKLWTNVNNVLGGMITNQAKARNKMLKDWKQFGGRTALIGAVSNAFKALMMVMKPIHEAFREIFPATTGKHLADMTKSFEAFTERLKPSKDTIDLIKRSFKGFFALLDIGFMVIKGVAHYLFSFISLLASGDGSVLNITASIGDLIVQFRDWLKAGNKIGDFFNKIIAARAKVFGPLIVFVKELVAAFFALATGNTDSFIYKIKDAFGSLYGVVDGVKSVFNNLIDGIQSRFPALAPIIDAIKSKIQSVINVLKSAAGKLHLGSIFDMGNSVSVAKAGIAGVGTALGSTAGAAAKVRDAWGGVIEIFKRVGHFLAPVWDTIKAIFTNLKTKIIDYVKNMGVDEGLSLVNTGFFIAFYLMLRKFIKSMNGLVGSAKAMFDNVAGVLKQATSNLKTMQKDIRANIILKIAAALLILAAALLILSRIKAKDLGKALGAVTLMMVQLIGALKALEKGGSIAAAAQVTALSAAMVLMAAALLVMAAAIAILGHMKVKTIAKGIGAMTAILAVVTAMVAALGATGGGFTILLAAAGMVILAAALVAFAGAVKLFSAIKTSTIVDGGLKIVAMLVGLGLAMALFPPTTILTAAGLLILANALVILAGAIKLIGMLGWGEILKAVITLDVVLGILAAAMYLMTGTVGGAAAMLLMAVALSALVPVLVLLGNVPWGVILKSMAALAIIFGVFGLASLLLAPVIPLMFALAGALLLLGVAIVGIGGGILLLSAGLTALAATGAAGVAVLIGAVMSIASVIPLLMHQLGLGIRAFASVLEHSGPPLFHAFSTVLMSLIKAIIKVTPKLARMLIVMLRNGLRVIRQITPDFVKTGFAVIMALLRGLRKNIGKIVDVTSQIVRRFLNALGRNAPKIVNAGFNMIIKFMNGLTKAINKRGPEIGRAGRNLAIAIISGLSRGLTSLGHYAVTAAKNMAIRALNGMFHIFNAHSPSKETHKLGMYAVQGLANGFNANAILAEKSAAGVAETALAVMTATLSKVPDVIPDVDMNPVITPILDLTKLQEDATKINPLLSTKPITADVSYEQASSISAAQQAALDAATKAATAPPVQEVKFEQNNYSPRALSSVEIYRKTKNQLSLAKEALKV